MKTNKRYFAKSKQLIFACLLFLGALLLLESCKKSSTEPVDSVRGPSENVAPGRRDYVWTMDTLESHGEPLYMIKLWGSAPNDVWAVGTGASELVLWHYDGNKWETNLGTEQSTMFSAIYGFSQNDVWAAGDGGIIWHYTGSWHQSASLQPEGFPRGLSFEDIWGPSPNEIYAVGAAQNSEGYPHAMIWKYNGAKWDSISVPELCVYFKDIRIPTGTNDLLLAGVSEMPGSTTYYVYVKTGNEFRKLYEGTEVAHIITVDGQYLVHIDRRLFCYSDGRLLLWKDFSNILQYPLFFPRNANDIFSLNHNGLLHWNGTDVSVLYPLDMYIGKPALFEKEVFFLFKDFYLSTGSRYNMILHGKLKD